MTPNEDAEFAMPFTCPPTHRRRRLASTLLGLAAALPAFGGSVLAESDRGAVTRFFDQENARVAPQAVSPDVREPAARVHVRPYRADGGRGYGYERHARPAPAFATAQKPPAPNPHRINVAVFGDRMGGALAAGLQDNDEADVTVLKATSDDAGLTRVDFPAWLQSIRDGLPAQHAAGRALVSVGDLGRLDVGDLLAGPDERALGLDPRGDLALCHRQAELRHGDGRARGAHGQAAVSRAWWLMTRRTAASTFSAFGT